MGGARALADCGDELERDELGRDELERDELGGDDLERDELGRDELEYGHTAAPARNVVRPAHRGGARRGGEERGHEVGGRGARGREAARVQRRHGRRARAGGGAHGGTAGAGACSTVANGPASSEPASAPTRQRRAKCRPAWHTEGEGEAGVTSAGKQAACESARRHDATGRASRAARVLCCETARSSVGEGQQRWRRRAQTEEEAAEVGQAACLRVKALQKRPARSHFGSELPLARSRRAHRSSLREKRHRRRGQRERARVSEAGCELASLRTVQKLRTSRTVLTAGRLASRDSDKSRAAKHGGEGI